MKGTTDVKQNTNTEPQSFARDLTRCWVSAYKILFSPTLNRDQFKISNFNGQLIQHKKLILTAINDRLHILEKWI